MRYKFCQQKFIECYLKYAERQCKPISNIMSFTMRIIVRYFFLSFFFYICLVCMCCTVLKKKIFRFERNSPKNQVSATAVDIFQFQCEKSTAFWIYLLISVSVWQMLRALSFYLSHTHSHSLSVLLHFFFSLMRSVIVSIRIGGLSWELAFVATKKSGKLMHTINQLSDIFSFNFYSLRKKNWNTSK